MTELSEVHIRDEGAERPLRIAQFGTFDVSNYGDLLFPLVARHFLRSFEFLFVSPKSGPPPVPGGVATISLDQCVSSRTAVDAVLIGGGNIIHAQATTLPAYREVGALGSYAYAGLWAGACLFAAERAAAVAWNAPGVAARLSPVEAGVLDLCTQRSDYVAFRERGHLAELPGSSLAAAPVVPDPAILLPDLLAPARLTERLAGLRERFALGSCYTVFHAKQRNLKTEVDKAAARTLLARLEANGPVVLLPLGRVHNDDGALAELIRGLPGRFRMADADLSLEDITALIAGAAFMLSCSLHGGIVASAYGTPVRVLSTAGQPKYLGYFEQIGRPDEVQPSWSLLAASMPARMAELDRTALPLAATAAARTHYAQIEEALRRPVDRRARGVELIRAVRRLCLKAAPMATLLPGALLARPAPPPAR